jgi:hypothetical protein
MRIARLEIEVILDESEEPFPTNREDIRRYGRQVLRAALRDLDLPTFVIRSVAPVLRGGDASSYRVIISGAQRPPADPVGPPPQP